jgi:predicted lipoprotein with Yx(FWY)xxD motif
MSRLSSLVTGWALAAAGGILAIAALAYVFLLSGGAPAAATAPARMLHRTAPRASVAAASTVISAHSSELGTILVGPNGDTLYAFSRDSRNKDVCASISGCLKVWPIMAIHGKLKAGTGVKASLLGTITVGGVKQATYAGHPLYGYIDNEHPADTDYVGISQSGGTWPAVSPSGKLIK